MLNNLFAPQWFKLATDLTDLSLDASMVVFCRTSRFFGGQLSQAEAARMFEEKPLALASAYREIFFASIRASTPAVTARAALRPVATTARENAQRLTER